MVLLHVVQCTWGGLVFVKFVSMFHASKLSFGLNFSELDVTMFASWLASTISRGGQLEREGEERRERKGGSLIVDNGCIRWFVCLDLSCSQSSPQLPHYQQQQPPVAAAAPAPPIPNSGWVQSSISPQPSSIYQPQSIPYQPLM